MGQLCVRLTPRTGTVASQTVVIEAGPVHGPHGGLMEHTLEPTLRKNGMPTKLNRGGGLYKLNSVDLTHSF
jgi:hypothetical protein